MVNVPCDLFLFILLFHTFSAVALCSISAVEPYASWAIVCLTRSADVYSSVPSSASLSPIYTSGLIYCMALFTGVRAEKWNSVTPVAS